MKLLLMQDLNIQAQYVGTKINIIEFTNILHEPKKAPENS